MAARLDAQEEQIRVLSKEVSRLRDGLCGDPGALGSFAGTPELESLRSENDKLRYRLLHLRRSLQAELDLEKQGREVAAKQCSEKECGRENAKITHGSSLVSLPVLFPSYVYYIPAYSVTSRLFWLFSGCLRKVKRYVS